MAVKTMKHGTGHQGQMAALARVEGQVRGIQKMVAGNRYCPEILNAIASARGALKKIESVMLREHLAACVNHAVMRGTQKDKTVKLREIEHLFKVIGK